MTLWSAAATAQWYDPDKVNSKAASVYSEAISLAQKEDYTSAIKKVYDALSIDPKLVDGYLSLGGLFATLKNYTASVAAFQKGIAMDSVYGRYYLLPYSISLSGIGQFDSALLAVNKFLLVSGINERSIKAGNFRKTCYEFAIDYEKKHTQKDYTFNPINLGDNINTRQLEYFPSLTIDGKKMIFTERINGNEDFYEADFQNGQWAKAEPLKGNINSEKYNEGAQNISQDGQWLIFTGCNFPEGAGSCDLYISFLTKKGWSQPENMGPNINTEFWESTPSLSPDKKDLYFSSNAPGGFGGKDIWVCHRTANGWSNPVNPGNNVNTAGDESCPFIHADNQTLYFNSNGHKGYSDKPDLYLTRLGDDGKWLPAENLGYPINTIDDEGSLIVAADGRTAYYASDRSDTKGGLDIYTFQLKDALQPLKTLWVSGRVYDKKTGNGLPSSVELTDVVSKKKVSNLQTDEEGNYLVTLPVGKDYAFNVARKGYLFYSENFNISNADDSAYKIDIPLQPIEANASIILKNVFFDTKQTVLKSESITELDNVVRLMNENPSMTVLITGYTDNVGQPADNLKLSTGRALSVVRYLTAKGVKAERLTSNGMGEARPIAGNETEQGKRLNRRTELNVLGN